MPSKTREELYGLFATGNKPTQDDFADLIDSALNIAEDGIGTQTGEPLELVQRGEKSRFLDLSSKKDNPLWRINAKSRDGMESGLNIAAADEKSRLFIKKANGYIGINNDHPQAVLDINSGSQPALRILDTNNNPSLTIDATGNIGIGTDTQDSYKVSIGGNLHLQGEVTVDNPVHAEKGIIVSGTKLIAHQGLSVENGAVIEGILEANNGLTVTGQVLTASNGIISGQTLEARNSLTVDNGAVIHSGLLEAKAGANVSGDLLTAANGLSVSNGAVINSGLLEAKAGASINGAVLSVNNGLNVQDNAIFNNGTIVEKGVLTVKEGLAVAAGAYLVADGPVSLGNTNSGEVIIKGNLQTNEGIIAAKILEAKAGLVVSGAELMANQGLTVQNNVLTVNNGLTVTNGSSLNADGPVALGSIETGNEVTLHGELRATNGALISGAELVVQKGISITGNLNAPDDSALGNATIDNLKVNNIEINGTFGLQAVDLQSLTTRQANIENLINKGQVEIQGSCKMSDNVNFETGILYGAYEGSPSTLPSINLKQGEITGEKGHFDITVDETQSAVTIIYNSSSEFSNLLSDWADYKTLYPDKTRGFNFLRIGTSSWELQDLEAVFISTGIFKEHVSNENGLRILYTGVSSDTPQFEIKLKEDPTGSGFEFSVTNSKLTIEFSATQPSHSVNQLLLDWQTFISTDLELAGGFELRKTTGSTGEFEVNEVGNTVLTPNSAGELFYKLFIKTNTVTINGHLKIGDSGVAIGDISSSPTLAENSDAYLATQKAVKSFMENKLALKADLNFVSESLALKADKQTVTDDLALKADKQTVTDSLDLKADKQTVTDSLALKADKQTVTDSLALKADKQTVTDDLALKADKQTVTDSLDLKADKQTVMDDLDLKADKQTVTDSLALKADKQTVMDSLALKADKQTVTDDLALKADKQTLTDGLALKAGLLVPADFTLVAGTTVNINAISSTAISRGLLMVRIATGDIAMAGLFAIHGTDSIIKIAGDGMTDQKDNFGTWNIYTEAGAVTVQNASSDEITVQVTYFGR